MSRLRWIGQRVAARLRDERGVSLIELLVAIPTGMVVVGGAVLFLIVSFHQQNAISSRSIASNQAESGLQQLTHDLRQAMTSVTVSSSGATTSISFQVPTPGNAAVGQSLTWTCPSTAATTVGTCTRTLAGTAKTVITGVKSMTFSPIASGAGTLSYPATPSSSPTLAAIAMTLQVQITNHGLTSNGVNVTSATSGTSPIVLQATADLRNFG